MQNTLETGEHLIAAEDYFGLPKERSKENAAEAFEKGMLPKMSNGRHPPNNLRVFGIKVRR